MEPAAGRRPWGRVAAVVVQAPRSGSCWARAGHARRASRRARTGRGAEPGSGARGRGVPSPPLRRRSLPGAALSARRPNAGVVSRRSRRASASSTGPVRPAPALSSPARGLALGRERAGRKVTRIDPVTGTVTQTVPRGVSCRRASVRRGQALDLRHHRRRADRARPASERYRTMTLHLEADGARDRRRDDLGRRLRRRLGRAGRSPHRQDSRHRSRRQWPGAIAAGTGRSGSPTPRLDRVRVDPAAARRPGNDAGRKRAGRDRCRGELDLGRERVLRQQFDASTPVATRSSTRTSSAARRPPCDARRQVWVGVRSIVKHRGGTLVLQHTRPISIDPALHVDLLPLVSDGLTRDGLVTYNHVPGPAGIQLVPTSP